jgi:hypothetical protein
MVLMMTMGGGKQQQRWEWCEDTVEKNKKDNSRNSVEGRWSVVDDLGTGAVIL